MTEPRSLEDLRTEIEQRTANNQARANGMRVPPSPASQDPTPIRQPEPEGFDAGDVWTFPYNLNPYVDAKGHIPPPSQAMLDTFERDMGKLMVTYEQAARDAEAAEQDASEAKEKEGDQDFATRRMAEVDQYLEEKNQALGKMKKIVAGLCQGSPSPEELDALPEYVFRRFSDAIGRKINPEV